MLAIRPNTRSRRAAAALPVARGGRAARQRPDLPNDVNAPAQRHVYHAVLKVFMEWKDSKVYADDRVFTEAELLTITPQLLKRWICFRVFGREDPSTEDSPTHYRSGTVKSWKKSISYFMPNNGSAWVQDPTDPTKGHGNPTKSRVINALISAIIRKETRGLGAPPKANKRSFSKDEILPINNLIGSNVYDVDRLRYKAMLQMQMHLIARCDDTAHLKKSNLEASAQFPGYLTIKCRWSKNVREERDCPQQIMLGSMDPRFCVLLAIAVFLETWISTDQGAGSQWLFADGVTDSTDTQKEQNKEAERLKNNYSKQLRDAIYSTSFLTTTRSGTLGTHSIRKFACSECRRRGASQDAVDYRGRWKSQRMQDRYTHSLGSYILTT